VIEFRPSGQGRRSEIAYTRDGKALRQAALGVKTGISYAREGTASGRDPTSRSGEISPAGTDVAVRIGRRAADRPGSGASADRARSREEPSDLREPGP